MCQVTPKTSCDLPSTLQAPALARDFVKAMLCTHHAQAAEAVLALLADELVTEAILYGAPPVSLTLACGTTEVTVEVADSSPDARSTRVAGHSVSMLLIDKIARSWGTYHAQTGKTVWCKVPSGAMPKARSQPWSTVSEPAGSPSAAHARALAKWQVR